MLVEENPKGEAINSAGSKLQWKPCYHAVVKENLEPVWDFSVWENVVLGAHLYKRGTGDGRENIPDLTCYRNKNHNRDL